jgi:non-heme chloroperoxidase
MGAWVARQIAIANPGRVDGLVLAGAFQSSLAGDPEAAAAMRELADVPDPVPAEVAHEFQVSTLASPIAAEQLDTFVAESLKLSARSWRDLFLGFAELDQPAGAVELPMPTLLVWGDQDAFVPESDQETLLATIPGSHLEVYRGIGHAVHWEEPARFAADLATFVDRLAD